MNSICSYLAYIENSIYELDEVINSMVTPYENTLSLMCKSPNLDRKSAITILSEIGDDVSHFNSSKQLCSLAGLTPGNNESAGKKKFVRITRTRVYPKPALVEAAM